MGEVSTFPVGAPEGSRFRREHRQGGVAGFTVIYSPLKDSDHKADPDLATWGVAIRTRGQDDTMILTGTFNAEIGPWARFEANMVDYAAIDRSAGDGFSGHEGRWLCSRHEPAQRSDGDPVGKGA